MTRRICPTCGKQLVTGIAGVSTTDPFCSERCRDSDLFRWFTEQHKVPVQVPPLATFDPERFAADSELSGNHEDF